MDNLAFFGVGLAIFLVYMFFLGRMIYKQHKIQEKNQSTVIDIRDYDSRNKKMAS